MLIPCMPKPVKKRPAAAEAAAAAAEDAPVAAEPVPAAAPVKKKPAAAPVAAEPVLAAAPVKKRPAAARVKKRPAAAPVAAPAAAPADAPAVAPAPAPADAPVPAPVVVAVPAVYTDADAPDHDYGIMYYKNNSIGVRAKFGLKNQLFCFGGQHCGKTKEQLRAIAVAIVRDLHRGVSVADAKIRGNELAFA